MHKRPRTSSLCIFCAFKRQQWPQSASIPLRQADYFHATPLVRQAETKGRTKREAAPPPIRFVRQNGVDNATAYKLRVSDKEIRLGSKRLTVGQKQWTPSEVNWNILAQLDSLRPELKKSSLVEGFALSGNKFDAAFNKYRDYVYDSLFTSQEHEKHKSNSSSVSTGLRNVFLRNGSQALKDQLRFGFYGQVVSSRFSQSDLKNQKALADLRYPWEWYARTRERKRTVHLHVGPTNSGKTYHALKRLEEAEAGCYAGPLRLLAHEVYTRLNAKGKACTLVTGDEFRLPPGWTDNELPKMHSSTVEMMPFGAKLQVVVIDEIQMMADKDRGWAWSEAFLGINAKEVHLCGEDRVVPLITELTKLLGDELKIHRYERLNPLEMYPSSLRGKLKGLQKGDCVVSFTILGIHALRAQIERATGKRCAVVYGSLPPETRAQQARLFNDPNNDYDFLVASDAIGMGLNLNIKRIIFETVRKNDGTQIRVLRVPEIKQIAGRAGRYSTSLQDTQAAQSSGKNKLADDSMSTSDSSPHSVGSLSNSIATIIPPAENSLFPAPSISPEQSSKPQNIGYVTTYDKEDYDIVLSALGNTAPPISQAGLLPTDDIVVRFSNYFPPGTPFSYVLLRLHDIAQVSSRFFICGLKETLMLADAIQEVKNLTIQERLTFCKAPIPIRSKGADADRFRDFVVQCARAIAEQRGGGILDIKALDLELLDEEVRAERKFLARAEALHKMLVGYLWLSFRFPGVFANRPLAMHTKRLVENVIEKSLSLFSFDVRESRRIRQQAREKEMMELLQKDLLGEDRASVEDARREHEESVPDGETATADQLERDEGLDNGEPQDVEDILRDDKSFAEEPSPEWDDEEEYPDDEEGDEEDNGDEEEPDMVTKYSPDASSCTHAVDGSKSSVQIDTSKSGSSDLSPLDSDAENLKFKSVDNEGPYYNKPTPSNLNDEQPDAPPSESRPKSEMTFLSGRPRSPEELARLMARERQRHEEQDARP